MFFDAKDLDQTYVHKFMHFKMLSKNEEEHLAKEWREYRNEDALHTLIKAYTRLVVGMACKLKRYGIPIADLIQEGNIGLITAAEKFNPKEHHNARFSTYARWWIKASQQKYILQNWSIVRMGMTTNNKQLFFNLDRLKTQLFSITTDHLEEHQAQEIADTLEISTNEVSEMEKRLNAADLSLNAIVKNADGRNKETLEDFIPDTDTTQEEKCSQSEIQGVINKTLYSALNILSERDRYIIEHVYLKDPGMNLSEVGKKLGISRERSRQLSKRALRKMHYFLTHTEHVSPRDLKTTY
ncbi:MAG: RNA polymerase factor sigma-32 [Alphaproteobacteria bacterium CG_4_10_14_0_8_um_filter_37_21]|nr:MAG: RNA polymerase factor sigma-32 [Alphaproteobacteria bacterium CG_4_10_14_0_8_um_filter_37_21]